MGFAQITVIESGYCSKVTNLQGVSECVGSWYQAETGSKRRSFFGSSKFLIVRHYN